MTVTVRPVRPGDGAALSRVWLSAAAYYADLDPEHFRVPDTEGLAESWDSQAARHDGDSLNLVAELDGEVVGWLWARIEPPRQNASAQMVRELGWTRLEVVSLIVHRDQWRGGAGTALLEAAEAWGRVQGARVARLDTYAHSPVSVPFYEEHMGYQRRSIVFQKQLLPRAPGLGAGVLW
jgi:GNAT superfamily N-acetyltransferase